MTCVVRVITQSLEANTSKYMMIVTCWRLIVQRQAGFKRNHTYMLQIWAKSLKTQKIVCKNLNQIKTRFLIRIRSVNRFKGVKLGFEYDHVAPSGFGVTPTKRVPTAMFSLVRIRPMFEQEAPKWPWEVFNNPDSNTIQVGPKRG